MVNGKNRPWKSLYYVNKLNWLLLYLLCQVCCLKISRPQPFWTVVLRALKEKENRKMKPSSPNLKYENIYKSLL